MLGAVDATTQSGWSPIALWAALGLIVVGTIPQPGIVASLVAAGLVAAAGTGNLRSRGATGPDRRSSPISRAAR
ncbi:hypothetical protein [Microbacterium wangruii]|uniref:hypothetical protein n=1 Tax=Microbacterium wangruii TaxID=3049073 RepID=UPI00256EA16E|nr:hypothetical protein [Microbacterium sp. zg-Y1211]MDL5485937.1 hypothetical protein [Microbacterium sp. zg-Y1211]